jgi:predicted dienelactone hydrolase
VGGSHGNALERNLIPAWILASCAAPPDLERLGGLGPHAIGHRTDTIEYMPPLATEARRLIVFTWYPAMPAAGERPFYTLRTSEVAVVGAPPAEVEAPPVLLFSHGHQAYAAAMSDLMEHVASHGFVAIAPTHTGNTFVDGADRTTDIYYHRSLDLRAALDGLAAIDGHPIARGHGSVAASGHSFGGYTAFAMGGATFAIDALEPACAAGTGPEGFCSTMTPEKAALFRAGLGDARIEAIVSVDPGDANLFDGGTSAVRAPILHMVAEASGDAYEPSLPIGTVRLLLRGGDHNDFTDACAAGLDLRCSDLPPPQVHRAVRILTLAFLEKHLLGEGDPSDLFDGTVRISQYASVSSR